MRQRILGTVVVRVVVSVDGLRLQAGDRVDLLDGCGAPPRQGAEDCALDL